MNHITNGFRSAVAEDKPLTRRAQSKLETRDKVLEAAKRLFIERGYEAATIRDIAQAAGMSTGAVFANFTDKSHLFHEVMSADLDSQFLVVRDVVNQQRPIEDLLVEFFSVGYRRHLDQLPLLQAAASLAWSQGLTGPLGERPQYGRALPLLQELIQKGIARRELLADVDTDLIATMLWDAYQANYRLALYEDWRLDRLQQRIRAQVAVILAGARV